ncbi:CocE/NonD family hydrolase (plasmid) [Streptomyces sp. BI20]|uniref:CocE/NonD family hydrolase n=1 Tax=Streptomyces sp. BI20 TaxID=3403460 RepID=UPI003C773D45
MSFTVDVDSVATDERPGRPPVGARLMRGLTRGLPRGAHRVHVARDLIVPGGDGTPLRADHWAPRDPGPHPTVLVRTPYGRGAPWNAMFGLLLAEHGFHVLIQSCRGTAGSAGAFHLWRHEAADGHAAVAWLRTRPWFDGRLAGAGLSYLGYTQWALAQDPPPELRALFIASGMHDPHAYFHAGGVLHLERALVSGAGLAHQHRGALPLLRAGLRLRRRLPALAANGRPAPGDLDGALGPVPWLDEALAHADPADPYWADSVPEAALDGPGVPVALVTGRHDVLAPQTLAQYARLRRAGRETRFVLGPWTHTELFGPELFGEMLDWLRLHLLDDETARRPHPVRVHTGEAGGWSELPDWPAPDERGRAWTPTRDGLLTPAPHRPDAPADAPADAPGDAHDGTGSDAGAPLAVFAHDPADPAPAPGGAGLGPGAGARDNSAWADRPDTVVFTSEPAGAPGVPADLLGPVSLDLTAATDTGRVDLFARLVEVRADGRSPNLCEGVLRVDAEPGEPRTVTVDLGALAHRLADGSRLRLVIGVAAGPRFAEDRDRRVPTRVTLYPAGTALRLPRG